MSMYSTYVYGVNLTAWVYIYIYIWICVYHDIKRIDKLGRDTKTLIGDKIEREGFLDERASF